MDAMTPEELRAGPLADLVELLSEADELLGALGAEPRAAAPVRLLADELLRARERARRPLTRLRLCLPPRGVPLR
jgi:hypothetical protein